MKIKKALSILSSVCILGASVSGLNVTAQNKYSQHFDESGTPIQ